MGLAECECECVRAHLVLEPKCCPLSALSFFCIEHSEEESNRTPDQLSDDEAEHEEAKLPKAMKPGEDYLLDALVQLVSESCPRIHTRKLSNTHTHTRTHAHTHTLTHAPTHTLTHSHTHTHTRTHAHTHTRTHVAKKKID